MVKNDLMKSYDLASLRLPKLTGPLLDGFAAIADGKMGFLLKDSLIENGGIPRIMREKFDEAPLFEPLHGEWPGPDRDAGDADSGTPGANNKSPGADDSVPGEVPVTPPVSPYPSSADYTKAYREGKSDPETVASKFLAALKTDQGERIRLNAFIVVDTDDLMRQAAESRVRWAAGKPLGLLDGVPVAVKDELDCVPYATSVGTRFLGNGGAAPTDSTVVARLRAAGALIVGKTNMHEIGIYPNGSNAHYGRVANPFDPERDSGGSSSGSAAAVAAGLCPVALGADGGGSVRIPAALCGVYGLKATFGRVSEAGAASLCWSVAHVGPIAASVADLRLAYSLIAGEDSRDRNTSGHPQPVMSRIKSGNGNLNAGLNGNLDDGLNVGFAGNPGDDLKGVVIGVFPDWNAHSEPGVAKACFETLGALRERGAIFREIAIPQLDLMRVAHAVTILSEMAGAMSFFRASRKLFSPSTRLSLALGDAMSSGTYLRAQQMRARAVRVFRSIFESVDLIASPATAIVAPKVPVNRQDAPWSDLSVDTELMRYAFPGNLTGLPAISLPAGYDAKGIPVGLQLMGRPWSEALLLHAAAVAEALVPRKRPARWYGLL